MTTSTPFDDAPEEEEVEEFEECRGLSRAEILAEIRAAKAEGLYSRARGLAKHLAAYDAALFLNHNELRDPRPGMSSPAFGLSLTEAGRYMGDDWDEE
jgi:hypothetical protein